VATVDYSGHMAVVYDAGRALSPDVVGTWMDAAARHVDPRGRPILDLGSGTGRFSKALSERFGVPVVGLEPAEGMRASAARRGDAGVFLVGGDGEHVPMPPGVFGAVWASQVIHHIRDRAALAAELGRVLMSRGYVALRGMLTARPDAIGWAPWFPEAAATACRQFPQLAEISAVFASVGIQR